MIELNRNEARQCIEALKAQAHDRAGHSQSPDLIKKEHTDEWLFASVLEERLKNANIAARNQQA